MDDIDPTALFLHGAIVSFVDARIAVVVVQQAAELQQRDQVIHQLERRVRILDEQILPLVTRIKL